MAESSWPSPTNGRLVLDAQYEKLLSGYVPSGVIGSLGDTSIVTTAGVGLNITIRAGKYAYVRGHMWYSGTSDFTKAIAANSSGNSRFDLIVLRLTRSTWNVTVEVVQGTPAGSPVVPAPTQDLGSTGTFEIPLAQVAVASGATSIGSGSVYEKDYYLSRVAWIGSISNRPTNGTHAGQWFEDDGTRSRSVWDGAAWLPGCEVHRFATTTSRDNTITGPVNGMFAYITGTNTLTYRAASAWSDITLRTWNDFTSSFIITSTGTQPTMGNSAVQSEYSVIGKTVHLDFNVTLGSTWASGSGDYRFPLPVNAESGYNGVGSLWVNDSGTALRVGIIKIFNGSHGEMYLSNITGGPLGSAGPGTGWVAPDSMLGSITYQAA